MRFSKQYIVPPPKDVTVPTSIDGKQVHYFYQDVPITPAVDPESVALGYDLSFVPGDKAALVLFDRTIGYLDGNKGRMVNEWLQKKLPLFSVVTGTDGASGTIKICLAFYEDRIAKAAKAKTRPIKLTGNKNSDMQTSILAADVGDFCELSDYDDEKGRWTVSCESGDIGFLRDPDRDYSERIHPVIAEITEDDGGKYIVSVIVK